MLRPPIKVKSLNMPEYSDRQDHLKYTSVSSDKDTLPRGGPLPLGLSRNLGVADNIPRIDPLKRPYARMIKAEERRMSATWAKPFMEDKAVSGPFIIYGEPVESKKWNRPLAYYEADPVAPPPRQYYSDVAPFVPEATSDFFVAEGGKLRPPFAKGVLADTSVIAARPKDNGMGLGDLWSDVTSAGNTLLKTAGDIYATYQTGEIAKSQAQIAQAQAQATRVATAQAAKTKSTLWSYLPLALGIGGGVLLLSLVLRGKK